jgi:ferredoxin
VAALVRVLPLDVTVVVATGESLMVAAERQGLVWPSVCRGLAECGTCYVAVESGDEHASDVLTKERVRLASGPPARSPSARLACQLRMAGPMTVRRKGVARRDGRADSRTTSSTSRIGTGELP